MTSGSIKAFSRVILISLKVLFFISGVQLRGVFPPLVPSYRSHDNSGNPEIQSLQNPVDPGNSLASQQLLGLETLRVVSIFAFDCHLPPPTP